MHFKLNVHYHHNFTGKSNKSILIPSILDALSNVYLHARLLLLQVLFSVANHNNFFKQKHFLYPIGLGNFIWAVSLLGLAIKSVCLLWGGTNKESN